MSQTSRKCPDLQRVRRKHGEEKRIINMLAQKKHRSAQEASTDLAMSRQTEFAGSHLHPVLKLQRTIGNHAVQRLLHAKTEGAKGSLGASASACFTLDARHNLESRVQRARRGGQPLPRQDKIHTDANATPLNRESKARVITTSQDKLSQKREGSFRISEGRKVLAHGATYTDLQMDVPQILWEWEAYAIREGPFPDVNTRLPDSGPGFTTHTFVELNARFGLPETVEALQAIAADWENVYSGAFISIGDISLQSGGLIRGHKSHQKGVDVDIWPVDDGGTAIHVSFNDPSYSQFMTQLLVDIIYANGVLDVKTIFFNDPAVRGVVPQPGHDEHLHVRFRTPYALRRLKGFPGADR